jgi:L,D-transpeptidase YbiS
MSSNGPYIRVNISQQTLSLYEGSSLVRSYRVNTAKNGVGETFGSECTPRGQHIIRAKIGDDAVSGSVFIGRRLTGEIYHRKLAEVQPNRDWILTRILWLSGLERGYNRLGTVDTMRRYIYIHGSPDELVTQPPSSHGCIRMLNADIVELFSKVTAGTSVFISE